MSAVARTLSPDNEGDELINDPPAAALGATLRTLLDGANPQGQGKATRHKLKEGNLSWRDPDILGEFYVKLNEVNTNALFVADANR
jgi:hypothetical protein